MLLSGACEISSEKQISSSEHVIPTCTLGCTADPGAEVLGCQGYQSHFPQHQEAACGGAWQLFTTHSSGVCRFRVENKEGLPIEATAGLELVECNYPQCTSLPPSF